MIEKISSQTENMETLLIKPRRHSDHRGFFAETYSRKKFSEKGISTEFVQDNQSMSSKVGTLRGLHFQTPPHAQAKLIRCGRGAFFDVAVDIRKGSPTYGKWTGYDLTAVNGYQLYIPIGFAHGFVTLEPDTEVVYKCSDYYFPENEGSVLWNDPEIGVDWPLKQKVVLSEKDKNSPLLKDFSTPFIFRVNS